MGPAAAAADKTNFLFRLSLIAIIVRTAAIKHFYDVAEIMKCVIRQKPERRSEARRVNFGFILILSQSCVRL